MKVHLVNPSDMSFGTAVITPRWLYVLAAATPVAFGDVEICDETLERLDPLRIAAGDIVGVGIHTGNAFRAYEVGRMARERGAWVVFGGIHATLYPAEVRRCPWCRERRWRCRLVESVERLRQRLAGTNL